ncbi:MAG: hypothetical protein WAW86_02755 [Gammaproteobacteria bacterium]
MKIPLKIFVFIAALSLPMIGISAENNKTVNVLTWWGYLDDPATKKLVKKECDAFLSYDSYTSNDDMLRRWDINASKYDVLIFSDTIYNSIKDKIVLNNSELWKKSKDYTPAIKKEYNSSHFPHNIAYFAHSLTGFVWNPAVVHLTKDDTAKTAFKKAKNNKVILLDDPVEISMLLEMPKKNKDRNEKNQISLEHFKPLIQESKIYISNEVNKIYSYRDFAFSYQWSGVAFSDDKNIKAYKFLINQHLSYVTTDVIAQIKDRKIAACVAGVLSSKQFLSKVQNKSKYFSPYGNIDAVPEGSFKETYKNFLTNLPKLHWLKPPSPVQLKKLNHEWDKVKYELTQNRE